MNARLDDWRWIVEDGTTVFQREQQIIQRLMTSEGPKRSITVTRTLDKSYTGRNLNPIPKSRCLPRRRKRPRAE